MSKVLTDLELGELVRRVIEEDIIDDAMAYGRFLADVAGVVAYHLGAENHGADAPLQPKAVGAEEAEYRWCVCFRATESTPDDGGVFADYDTDKSVAEWLAERAEN